MICRNKGASLRTAALFVVETEPKGALRTRCRRRKKHAENHGTAILFGYIPPDDILGFVYEVGSQTAGALDALLYLPLFYLCLVTA